jgi:hypothetical protein
MRDDYDQFLKSKELYKLKRTDDLIEIVDEIDRRLIQGLNHPWSDGRLHILYIVPNHGVIQFALHKIELEEGPLNYISSRHIAQTSYCTWWFYTINEIRDKRISGWKFQRVIWWNY